MKSSGYFFKVLVILTVVLFNVSVGLAREKGIDKEKGKEAINGKIIWTLTELLSQLADIKNRRYSYTETRRVSFLRKPAVSKGVLVYAAPDTLEKNVIYPKQRRYRIVGDRMYIQKNGKKERKVLLTNYPELLALSESLRATFSGKQKILVKYYIVKLEGRPSAWKLSLTPIDIDLIKKIEFIEIFGSNKKLKRIVIKEQDGDQSDLVITEK